MVLAMMYTHTQYVISYTHNQWSLHFGSNSMVLAMKSMVHFRF